MLYMVIANGGNVAISPNPNPIPTPEYPLGTLLSVIVPLAAFSALFAVKRRRLRLSKSFRDSILRTIEDL
jgi:hypothetical protein